MVKHIILWQLKDEFSQEEKAGIKKDVKAGLEGLAGQIPGLIKIHVQVIRCMWRWRTVRSGLL